MIVIKCDICAALCGPETFRFELCRVVPQRPSKKAPKCRDMIPDQHVCRDCYLALVAFVGKLCKGEVVCVGDVLLAASKRASAVHASELAIERALESTPEPAGEPAPESSAEIEFLRSQIEQEQKQERAWADDVLAQLGDL